MNSNEWIIVVKKRSKKLSLLSTITCKIPMTIPTSQYGKITIKKNSSMPKTYYSC